MCDFVNGIVTVKHFGPLEKGFRSIRPLPLISDRNIHEQSEAGSIFVVSKKSLTLISEIG